MQRELSALKLRLGQLERDNLELAMKAKASPNAVAAPEVPAGSRADRLAHQEMQRKEYIATIEAGYRNEPFSQPWSSDTTAIVKDALARNNDVRQLVKSVDCRTRTCRV